MNNVVRLFDRQNVETVLSEPERILTAVTNILAASTELDHAVKELSKRFDAIENAIASIDNVETRSRLKQSSRLSRETLFGATLQLTQVIGEFIGARGVRESVCGNEPDHQRCPQFAR
jgi:hypothetical protein